MKYAKVIMASIALVSTSMANASHRTTLDDDGCWDGRTPYGSSCLSTTSKWSTSKYSTKKLIVSMTNICSYRLYARYCNQRTNGGGGKDCGASGIMPGAIKKWATSYATGRYSSMIVGADIPSKDWVCSGKVRDWRKTPF